MFLWFIVFSVIQPKSAASGLGWLGPGPWAGVFGGLLVDLLLPFRLSRPGRK